MNEKFESGAVRDQRAGKGRYDLIPPEVLARLARVLEDGAKKYAERNWEAGIPMMRCLDSLLRHLSQWHAGEVDEDHLGHALANIAFMVTFDSRGRADLDDRPATLIQKAAEAQAEREVEQERAEAWRGILADLHAQRQRQGVLFVTKPIHGGYPG